MIHGYASARDSSKKHARLVAEIVQPGRPLMKG
jgi:hypothetical protein